MDLFQEVITVATENGNMEILPALWNLTLLAKERGDGAILRQRITKKIPEMARYYGMEAASGVRSFPLFTKVWKAEMTVLRTGSLEEAFIQLARSNNDMGIYYILDTRGKDVDLEKIFEQLVTDNNLYTIKFLYNIVKYYDVKRPAILRMAARLGKIKIIESNLRKGKSSKELRNGLFEIAVKYGQKEIVQRLIELGVSKQMLFNSSSLALRNQHTDLADYLLQYDDDEKTNLDGFLEYLFLYYEPQDLILRHIHDVKEKHYKSLFWSLLNHLDTEMINFIAQERPEMLPFLLDYIDHEYDGGLEDQEREYKDESEEEFFNELREIREHVVQLVS